MQFHSSNPQFAQKFAQTANYPQSAGANADSVAHDGVSGAVDETVMGEPTVFQSQFIDSMEMYADAKTVADYLDVHPEWFHRCAQPMVVEAIGANSYALTIGHFGAFGYDIEPKIGLDLLPQNEGVYRIETVPVPNYTTIGYDVDFRAAMKLVELPSDRSEVPDRITHVQWQLDLAVSIQFPKFIHALPDALIQRTGERVLTQVVRQVSRRLTHKVQEDFHSSRNLVMPTKRRKWL